MHIANQFSVALFFFCLREYLNDLYIRVSNNSFRSDKFFLAKQHETRQNKSKLETVFSKVNRNMDLWTGIYVIQYLSHNTRLLITHHRFVTVDNM